MAVKRNKIPEKVDYKCKLLMDQSKITLVIVYHESPETCENQASPSKISEWCSIDPGIRTLYTIYSPVDGVAYELGKGDISRLCRHCRHMDVLISEIPGSKNKQRRLKALLKMRKRLKNLVKEVHCKVVLFLVRNFKNTILPSFDVSKMVCRGKRRLNSKSVRQVLTWSHYSLKQRHIYKASVTGSNVHITTEEWASKTCTNCLKVNHCLGGAKTFRCPSCGLTVDRDLNGARNIFLKFPR
mmetsp:Transcript_9767/g.29584  ORF Transcript_9767/g.29584 Transcript_9767/m.29584 type:complete len:241 (+) Transcript_9767:2816-3538(+)|eukprot:351208-Chlamydomonas_euryale.AAC.5